MAPTEVSVEDEGAVWDRKGQDWWGHEVLLERGESLLLLGAPFPSYVFLKQRGEGSSETCIPANKNVVIPHEAEEPAELRTVCWQ